jgi:hypothetical protein
LVVPLQTEALVGLQVQPLDLVALANGQHFVPAPGAQATESWGWFAGGLVDAELIRRSFVSRGGVCL